MAKKKKGEKEVVPPGVKELIEPLASVEKTMREMVTRPLDALGIPYLPPPPGPAELALKAIEEGPEAVTEALKEAADKAEKKMRERRKTKGWGM